ncbi:MAG: AEC family transporter [Eubacteriales bacterium]|nr:AEC family transporter [Eubacteriales bacterium]
MEQVMVQLALLFAYIGAGFLCRKVKLLDEVSDHHFSRLILNVTLPASIIASAIGQESGNRGQAYLVLGLALFVFLLLPVMGHLFQRFTGCEDTYKLMLTYSNLGFMGFPIMEALYGQTGMFYAALFMMVFNASIFSYGISVLEKGRGFDFKRLLTPGMISAVLALLIFSLNLPVPGGVEQFLSTVGDITSPLAMITLGSTLAGVSMKAALQNKMLYLFSLCKLVLWPALIWGILQFFVEDPVVLGVCTILVSLPVAGNVSMLCISSGGNKKLAAEGTLVSTILSLFSIPVYMMLFL